MSVTGSDSHAGETIKSGNVTRVESETGYAVSNVTTSAGLEEAEAGLHALMGTKPADRNDPAEVAKREERMRRFLAKKDGGMCSKCGRGLDADEAVYIAVVWAGYRPFTGSYGRHHGPVYEACAPPSVRGGGRFYRPDPDRWEKAPCDGCGRLVGWQTTRRDYYRRHVFCSERCQWTHYNGLRNERNARAREKACEVCEAPFTATRRDAKTCSRACKQKAYRRRKAAT